MKMKKPKPVRILFAGGGTGGHFYPIIAVAESVIALSTEEHITNLELYYMSDAPYDAEILAATQLSYIEVTAGKRRTYFSLKNFFDIFKTLYGCLVALIRLAVLYPDVIFGKGGYASFPAMFAARILRIPVVIHESDIVPGKVNRWIGNYAAKVALAYPEAERHFSHKDRIALTGQPIRKGLLEIPDDDPYETFGLEPGVPVILAIGGSQGAERINEELVDIMPRLLEHYQVVHQTGETNYEWMRKRVAGVLVAGSAHTGRYHPFAYLNTKQLALAGKAAMLIVSRAGSAIFEIALWAKPSILIPLPIAHDDHQRENAYSYARTGAAIVIEEQNLKPELLLSVINSVATDETRRSTMVAGAKQFAKTDAAEKIAQALLSISTKHD
ncbi:MAG TPA: UDP-N-acetylglucosamine--N-acetylmuramyl-(pentapeptide) pyrophosphoryl-undecaprenol N-acetylglucosamine transferase [Candidatus Paceibacterota bacterium]